MQICIILLGGLMALTEPTAGRGEQAPPVAPAVVKADGELMKQLQARIESIPEPDRVRLGVEILVEHAEQFQSDFFRNRVYLSIGDLYKLQGNTERALEYFGKAGGPEAEVIGSISRNRVFDTLESQDFQEDIPARAISSRDHLQVSDQEYADLTHRAAFALISSGKRVQAVDLAIQAAEQRPCARTFHVLETVSASADRPDDRAPLLRGMHWLARNSGEFGRTLRFLGNLAQAEEFAGNIDEAARIRLEIVAGFPDSPETCNNILLWLAGPTIGATSRLCGNT
jgi:tetratricopeptide (TPR) repeat protein